MFNLQFTEGQKVYVSCDGGTTGVEGVIVKENNERPNWYLVDTEENGLVEEKVDCIFPHTILKDW